MKNKPTIKNINARVSIHRISSSISEDVISLNITDDISGIKFVDVNLSLKDFSRCITGQAEVNGKGRVVNIEYIGKIKEVEKIEFKMPNDTPLGHRKDLASEIAKSIAIKRGNAWQASTYFDRQDSFFVESGKDASFTNYARTTLFRYVEPTD